MKFLLATVFICAVIATTSAQSPWGFGPPSLPISHTAIFQAILQEEASLLLAKSLSADLAQRVDDELNNAKLGFEACELAAASVPLPWIKIRCVTTQFKTSKTALKAIENEANAAAAATDPASPASNA